MIHPHEVQEQAKLICGDRNRNSVSLGAAGALTVEDVRDSCGGLGIFYSWFQV